MESVCTHSKRSVVYHPTALFPSTDTPAFGQVQAGEVTKSAHPARFSPDDKYSSKAILLPMIGKIREADRGNLHRTSGHSKEALWAALDAEQWVDACALQRDRH